MSVIDLEKYRLKKELDKMHHDLYAFIKLMTDEEVPEYQTEILRALSEKEKPLV